MKNLQEGSMKEKLLSRLSKKRGRRDFCKAGISRRVQAAT
jgi:hypothetical protein